MTEQEFNNSDVTDVTMTSYRRLRRSAFLNESTWSPMPEHILNLHIEEFQPEEKKVFGNTVEDVTNDAVKLFTCDVCDMTFKTQAMAIYHKAVFCVGSTQEDIVRSPDPEVDSYTDHVMSVTPLKEVILHDYDTDATSDGTTRKLSTNANALSQKVITLFHLNSEPFDSL